MFFVFIYLRALKLFFELIYFLVSVCFTFVFAVFYRFTPRLGAAWDWKYVTRIESRIWHGVLVCDVKFGGDAGII